MTSPYMSLDDVKASASICSQDTQIFFEIDMMLIYHHMDNLNLWEIWNDLGSLTAEIH